MKVKLTKSFRFEAAHCLDHLPKDHPCHNIHGHSYRVMIEVCGEVNPATGFLIDYGDLKQIVKPLIDQLDHSNLNEIEGLRYSSTENLAKWLWGRIKPDLAILSTIRIFETETTSCEYNGE